MGCRVKLSSRLEIADCLDISLAGQFVFQVYRGKVLIFIESKAFVYRFARDLSNFCQKQGCDITKRNDFA